MSEKYKYKLDDRIYFDMGNNLNGWASIKGCSTEPMPELGRGWIVELDDETRTIDKKVYPYTNIVVFDVMIKEPPVKETPPTVTT